MNHRIFQCLHCETKDGPKCGLILNDLNKFFDHLRTHSKEKPFKCTFEGCNYAFAQKGNLKRHLNSHYGIKKFECNECNKRFSNG